MENLQKHLFPKRKVWIKTFGCQMNYHDTERMLSYLNELNFDQTEKKEEADLILFNTCAVRDLSNQKFYSQLGEAKHVKNDNKNVKVGIAGCVAQTEGKELIKKYPQLDFAMGTDVIDSIGEYVYRLYQGEDKFAVNSWDRSSDYSIETKITHGSPQAFVNIIKGCNKCCSYCIVPFTRGKERSRKRTEVVDDIKKLVEYSGIQEVTLLGQNVNSYGKDNGERLSDLLIDLEDINGLELIRYTTSYPHDVTDDLIAVHGSSKKLADHLHLPVQSGNNNILDKMRREHTVDYYLNLIEKLRAAKPDIVLSTDIIVGFPNETEEEYEDTLKLLDIVKYDSIYAYSFSKRNGTRAAKLEDNLTKDIRKRRLRNLQEHQLKIQAKVREPLVGKKLRLLVDSDKTFKGETKWKGKSSCNRSVYFKNELDQQDLLWNWVDVEVTETTALACQGKLLNIHGKRLSN